MLGKLQAKFSVVWDHLDERNRRIMAASEAMTLGHGGVTLVHRACGLSRKAVSNGILEIREGSLVPVGRIRKPGGGRKSLASTDPKLAVALEKLVARADSSDRARFRG